MPRPPSFTVAFDRRYDCSTCQTENLTLHDHVNHLTWTCTTCGQPVQISVAGADGLHVTVERHPAQALQPDDIVALEHKPSQRHLVLASAPAMGKGQRWYICLEGFGGNQVEPNRYYNRLPR